MLSGPSFGKQFGGAKSSAHGPPGRSMWFGVEREFERDSLFACAAARRAARRWQCPVELKTPRPAKNFLAAMRRVRTIVVW